MTLSSSTATPMNKGADKEIALGVFPHFLEFSGPNLGWYQIFHSYFFEVSSGRVAEVCQ